MVDILNSLQTMFKFSYGSYSTDDHVWLNWIVTRFRSHIQPLLNNTFDANLILIKTPNIKNFETSQISKLYIGSYPAALCYDDLKHRNITHILSLVDVDSAFPDDFTYKTLPCRDSCNENLIAHINEAINFINDAFQENGNILVHCFYGRSRSVSIVIGYMIKVLKYSYIDALNTVKKHRHIAQPNTNFENQLKFLESCSQDLKRSWLILIPECNNILPACNHCFLPLKLDNSIFFDDQLYHRSCLNINSGQKTIKYIPSLNSIS